MLCTPRADPDMVVEPLAPSVGVLTQRGMGAGEHGAVGSMTVLGSGESRSRKVTDAGRIRQQGAERARSGAWSLENDRCLNAYGILMERKNVLEQSVKSIYSNRGKRPGGQAAARWRMRSGKGRMGGAPGMSSRLPR